MEERYIYDDSILLSKLIQNPELYERTDEAEKFCTDMGVKSQYEYYAYQVVMQHQLDKRVKYSDVEGFRRMKNEEYLDKVEIRREIDFKNKHSDKCIMEVLPDYYFKDEKKLVLTCEK